MSIVWSKTMPTLGFLAADWIEAHCHVPTGWDMGAPFIHDGWQLENTLNFYRVKPDAKLGPGGRSGASQFVYRRGQVVGPQKTGKSPWGASITLFEAVGPSLFGGWARRGAVYRCVENGCGCGWEYRYRAGEPLGVVRPTSKIQLLATAEDQVENLYGPLRSMVQQGPLSEVMKVRGDSVVLPRAGMIEVVTAAANSKLGAPITFFVADETGIYTGKLKKVFRTMLRGVAGMAGRSIALTNPWDPMEDSVAQDTHNSSADDIWRYYRHPPKGLDYMKAADRRKIHEFVYAGSPWVDLESIEREAVELLEKDPASARRFFGNELVQGLGAFMPAELWDANRGRWPLELAARYDLLDEVLDELAEGEAA